MLSETDTLRPGILATKLYIPPAPPTLVARARLTRRLDAALTQNLKLILISAPTGFGKTALLSEWLNPRDKDGRTFAWLSLDEGDNDPVRFFGYVIAALGACDPSNPLWNALLEQLYTSPGQPLTGILTSVLNHFQEVVRSDAMSRPFILVLDDYHIITTPAIHTNLQFLIEHLPASLLLVITTRADPPLQLARRRARGEMLELREADLRFTPHEATAFLNQAMALHLSGKEIDALEERTEGWIAGLQLAALALQASTANSLPLNDRANLIAAFTGSHRYIVDYLVEEVLARLPTHVQQFLVQTSILERMSGPLCDAVTGGENGAQMLAQLERDNLFVVPLGATPEWYRYHHLFAELLQHRLAQVTRVPVRELHSRASAWFAANGFISEAIQHALAAEDATRAADLIEQNSEQARKRGEDITLSAWLDALPQEMLRTRTRLALARAATLIATNQLDAAEDWINTAEHLIEQSDDGSVSLRGEILVLGSQVAFFRNQLAHTIELAQTALDWLPPDSYRLRERALLYMGLAYAGMNQLDRATEIMEQVSRVSQQEGDIHHALYAEFQRGAIQYSSGQLHRAAITYRAALELAHTHGVEQSATAGWIYSDLGGLMYEWNDLELASNYIYEAIARGRRNGAPRLLTMALGRLVHVRQAQGDLAGALELCAQAVQLVEKYQLSERYASHVWTNQVIIWVKQGQLRAAEQWAESLPPLSDGLPSYAEEARYVALARIYLAKNELARALGVFEQVYEAAKQAGRLADIIGVLPLQALAQNAMGDPIAARETLERALELAVPEKYIRTFLDEGDPLYALVLQVRRALLKRPANSATQRLIGYVNQVLDSFSLPRPHTTPQPAQVSLPPLDSEPQTTATVEMLAPREQLTERELQILQRIAAGDTNAEIAQQLVVETSTVKKHINHLFAKLGVRTRAQALARARQLGWLT
jgi:LuxR family transcriptional regulator, maltose regulon positive regulatory protein